MTATVPWFVTEKRAAKASKIARALHLDGVSASDAARLDDEQRRAVEERVGIDVKHKASGRTWRTVVEMLAGSAMPGALCPTCGIGDPLGEPGPRKPYLHDGACAK